ncbi:TRAP transporter large permease [uncultured Castellaniella sp.]|uniref:TRAP transporter large permease n=1 Tax=uncultured Castellaniella sp. TaxID=647907 RepID=UPI00261EDB60|nr:TRAP transporter large permease [uncultured Castellaniella sp.]
MDPLLVGLCGIVLLLALIAIRFPIGIAMGLVGFLGVLAIIGAQPAIGVAKAVPYELVGDWNLSAVPMFLLMGYFASAAGLTRGLFRAARIFLGKIPGGLASATVIASALFASASGSSVATAAAFSRIAVPEMLKARYAPSLATACVASAGTLGSLIPPSVLLIIYGLITDLSIGTLFVAAVLPGILSAIVYIGMITVRCKLKPELAPHVDEQYTAEDKKEAVRDIWPLPLLIVGVLGGIFTGIFTATEAGAVGAFLAVIIAVARGQFSFKVAQKALFDTAVSTSAIFIIVVGAAVFSRFIALSTIPVWVTGSLSGFDFVSVIILICILYLILGCFMESISIMLLTLPVLTPLLEGFGVNMIWFGVLVTKLLEIGLITPPLGLNVYVIRSSLGKSVKLGTLFRGVSWFIAADVFTVACMIVFPALMLWLPSLMR